MTTGAGELKTGALQHWKRVGNDRECEKRAVFICWLRSAGHKLLSCFVNTSGKDIVRA